jgi:hypothetical protein
VGIIQHPDTRICTRTPLFPAVAGTRKGKEGKGMDGATMYAFKQSSLHATVATAKAVVAAII